ncbi:hypothetical protein EUGRSUZ_H04671 [Eucalyptus grandis]|uniref:Uncharacterized protein n=2 Tax=Eucalyptus grandis TaxID=71139 RepID=A0ACC3JYR4_EUCGR|nr:hypothetical protein EUGRSUZ_H04671 [Eucalyptus grandis]
MMNSQGRIDILPVATKNPSSMEFPADRMLQTTMPFACHLVFCEQIHQKNQKLCPPSLSIQGMEGQRPKS